MKFYYSLFLLLFLFIGFGATGQGNPRAEKLLQKADLEIRNRNFPEAIELLEKSVKIDESFAKGYLKLASIYSLYRNEDTVLLYYNKYLDVTPVSKVAPALMLKISDMNFQAGDYDRSRKLFNYVHPDALNVVQQGEYELLKRSLDFANSASENTGNKLEIVELPKEINEFDLQYFPVLTVDEHTLFFTRMGVNKNEDIVVSHKANGQWQPALSVSPVINTDDNEGACTISADGRVLIFTSCNGRESYGSCDLYICFREGDAWSLPENLGPEVNTPGWESQPSLSPDGKTLLFSSNRPGGYGKRDIWISRFDGENWSTPGNPGTAINTPQDEISPFLHASRKALFFSSDGHPGLGGYDLYMSEFNQGHWSRATNLGAPVNSFKDEVGLFITASGKTGYFSKETSQKGRVEKSKIVSFNFPEELVRNKSSYVTGRVLNAETNEPIQASFSMENLADAEEVYQVTSDSITGRFFLVLNQGQEYGVFVSKPGYLFEDLNFVAEKNTLMAPDTVDIFLNPIREGQSVILENIYFDFNEATLDDKSKSELKEIIKFLKDNPQIQIAIEGHTDNIGTDAYNQDLSLRRARSVAQYLIDAGIPQNSITSQGFGSKNPISGNNTEEGRQINRRIEFRIRKIF